jgi:phosphoglucosamine mutase
MQRAYFGTDGVRGPYGGPVLNEDFVARLGRAAARWAAAHAPETARVLIGRDTRASGSSLVRAFAAGLQAEGALPVSLGIIPTPAVSRSVRIGGAALGAVVTASHNPASDNGIKLFGPDGAKLTDEEEAQIELLIGPSPGPAALGEDALQGEAALEPYIEAAVRLLPAGSLRGWKVAVDTANGATYATTPTVLLALGAQVTAIGDRPDGSNINAGVGSEHPERLAGLVLSSGSRLGIAQDGDGDRCVLCDELGAVLDGDEILAILATHALSRGTLPRRTLIVTVQSNLGLDAAVEAAGGRVVRTDVGDRYVAQAMRESGARLGGESSGHVICLDFGPTGDGLAAALRVASVMLETGRPLSQLRRVLTRFPQLSRALVVREKRPLESLQGLGAAIREAREDLGGRGRVLVRYSGTEPKLRLLVEGPTQAAVAAAMEGLAAAARADLEVL